MDAGFWLRIPDLVALGDSAAFADWPLPRLIDTLQKLGHDALCVSVGATPRYFPRLGGSKPSDAAAVMAWLRSLCHTARHAEHPWNSSLMVESLVQQGRVALSEPAARRPIGQSV